MLVKTNRYMKMHGETIKITDNILSYSVEQSPSSEANRFSVKKFPTFYGTRRFITAFTSARHLSLSWASWTQSISHPTSWRSILILSSHLRLGLPSGVFPSGFPTKIHNSQGRGLARDGRSGDRIPVAARFSAPVQTGPGAHPASCTKGTGSFAGVKCGRGVTLNPHSLLVPWSRKSRAIPLLPLWAVRPVQSLSACRRVHFTFTFTMDLS